MSTHNNHFELGQQFLEEENYEQAFEQFQLVAEDDPHYMDSRFNMALMCQRGVGTVKNLQEAIRWYEEVAKSGDEAAMYNLAALYRDGDEGLDPDDEKFFHWMRLSARQGNDRAMNAIYMRLIRAVHAMATELELSPQWIEEQQFFQISIPIPGKGEEDELQAILKVGEKILFLAVYPFGEVADDHRAEMETWFDDVNQRTKVVEFVINEDDAIDARAVINAEGMILEVENFAVMVKTLRSYIIQTINETLWMYEKLA